MPAFSMTMQFLMDFVNKATGLKL